MVIKCHITFDHNPEGTFYSGSTIAGKVEIVLDTPTKVRGIALKITGRAETKWMQKNKSSSESEVHSGVVDYLSTITYLVGSDTGNTLTISPGIHTHNFACALPLKLPSSFEGTHGHVRYSAQILFDRPWKFDKTYTVGMTVLKLIDLNYESPVLRMPSKTDCSEEFWCGPCTSSPFVIDVQLPQTGYVPGEAIIVTTDIHNTSKISAECLHVALIKIIKYHSDLPRKESKNEEITITEAITGKIKGKTKETFRELLRIPAIPPTCKNLCKIIEISYEVRVKAKIRSCHKSPQIVIPIMIGNIPFTSVITRQPSASPEITAVPIVDNLPMDSIPVSTGSSEIAPPSYEEAVYMKRVKMTEGEEHPISETDYIPRYPVYNFSPSAPNVDEFDSHNRTSGIWL